MLLYRRFGQTQRQLLDVGCYVQRLDIDQLVESMQRAPAGKLADGMQVCPTGIGIAYMRREILNEPLGRIRRRRV